MNTNLFQRELFTVLFRNRKNGKVVHFLLGFMLHDQKLGRNHKKFGEYMNDVFLGIDRNACLPVFLTDGEAGLREFVQV
jgi:hypothetical protein